jgi:hypothetical protein
MVKMSENLKKDPVKDFIEFLDERIERELSRCN